MNKFLVMIILKPDIKENRINTVQSSILNLFEQSTKVKKVWYLGRKKLDFKNKRYAEGIYLKLDISAHSKRIEQIRNELRKNQDILSSVIINNESEKKSKLPSIKIRKLPFYKNISINNISVNSYGKKVYMLISKNVKLPFAESDIIAISKDENKVLSMANKKLQEYIYVKGFRTLKHFKVIKEVENELRKTRKVQFSLDTNPNIGQELIIQERYLI